MLFAICALSILHLFPKKLLLILLASSSATLALLRAVFLSGMLKLSVIAVKAAVYPFHFVWSGQSHLPSRAEWLRSRWLPLGLVLS